jgi:hypothetical protein
MNHRIAELPWEAGAPRRSAGSAGLGLVIVKQIADLHGGRIEIQSEVGIGTSVKIRLPCAASSELDGTLLGQKESQNEPEDLELLKRIATYEDTTP